MRYFSLLFMIYILFTGTLFSETGDTLKVRTIEFGEPRTGWFDFPDGGESFEKIVMNYRLKCPCLEWDYLAYVYTDQFFAPSFRVNGAPVDTFSYMNDTSWTFMLSDQEYILRNQVIREGDVNSEGGDIEFIGSEAVSSEFPFRGDKKYFRYQSLWTAEELSAAGVLQGNITGMRFDVAALGSTIRHLTVSLKEVDADELPGDEFVSGLDTVFSRRFGFEIPGESSLEFTRDFSWDGESDLAVVIEIDNLKEDGAASSVRSSSGSAIGASYVDKNLFFNGDNAYVKTFSRRIGDQSEELTLSAWINVEKKDHWDGIITTAGSGGFSGLVFGPENGGERYPLFRIMNQGSIDSNVPVVEGEPTHIAAVWKSGEYMRIYVNGELAAENTTDVFEGSLAIDDFWFIGRDRGNDNRLFDGTIDDVQIWSKALTENEIENYMSMNLNPGIPDWAFLELYYDFDADDTERWVNDKNSKVNNGQLFGDFTWTREMSEPIETIALRPNVLFEQGEYESEIRTTPVVDTAANAAFELVLYDDENSPTAPTETKNVWPTYQTYVFDEYGEVIDSLDVEPDETLIQDMQRVYFIDPYVERERYEVFRYITPYGNGLSLGADGWTWKIDVTDFWPVLQGSDVYIYAPNSQEDLELTFDFIEGTPPRDIVAFRSMWNFSRTYHVDFDESLPVKEIDFKENEKMVRLKLTQTGHGFTEDNPCAEFCSKEGYVFVNGEKRYTKAVWRDDCGRTPLYPQGGTWPIKRSNWCPGMEVWYYDWELTDFITSGQVNTVDYDMEYYDDPISGFVPNYRIASVLISYDDPNFQNDAEVYDIIAPSDYKLYNRLNPICGSPSIILRNRGANDLTSLRFEYGLEGGVKTVYDWEGELEFLEKDTIYLPPFESISATDGSEMSEGDFIVEISEPNGVEDEYPNNDVGRSKFVATPEFNDEITLDILTNNFANEQYFMYLKNAAGDVIFERGLGEFQSNYRYLDTLKLEEGCYEFEFYNVLNYGIDFWFTRDNIGAGHVWIMQKDVPAVRFGGDFGERIYYQFRAAPKPTLKTNFTEIDFGQTLLGESQKKTLILEPGNVKPIEIYDVEIIFGNPKGFAVEGINRDLADLPIMINPGEKLELEVSFTPEDLGNATKQLRIESSDFFESALMIPLTGRGVDELGVYEIIEKPDLELRVISNPVSEKGVFKFRSSALDNNAEISLFNYAGARIAKVYSGSVGLVGRSAEFDFSALPAGVYYATMTCRGSIAFCPVIVEK